MSWRELKPCPFCGAVMEPYGDHAQHPGDDCVLSQMIIFDDAYDEWNTRTPDPAQIWADAANRRIAELIEFLQADPDNIYHLPADEVAALRALIDTPLSPSAVDNSPAPDAGGKEGV